MNILLIEPNFPFPSKSKNKANKVHKNFVPVGLLKFAALYKERGDHVKLVRGTKSLKRIGFVPDEILVTSLFTYWSQQVWDCIDYYRSLFPNAVIKLGGIYATLHADTKKLQNLSKIYNVEICKGLHPEAEQHVPDYSYLPPVDYHATHMMRGCIRRCSFCGTWRIEPKISNKTKDQILNELKTIKKNKVIFYDNNLLANPNIKEILRAFSELRIHNRPVIFESQSGFDGRLLEKDPELAVLIKKSRFQNVRIAWDNGLEDKKSIRKQIGLLTKAGYATKDISIFTIYNFDRSYEDMSKKLECCKKWGVQITDCRYRPLNLDYDNYNPHTKQKQPRGSYYIHRSSGWTDEKIRDFRHKVRVHNIWIRYAKDKGAKYNKKMEKWSRINNTYKYFKLPRPPRMEQIEKSNYLSKRITLLNKLKNHCEINKIQPPDFSCYSSGKLQKYLIAFYNKHGIKKEKRQRNSN